MLSDKPGRKLKSQYVSDYVVFDLETTGVSCRSDEVVEISAIKVLGGEVKDEFSTLVNPGRFIPNRATEVHGIDDEMVKDAPTFGENRWKRLYRYITACQNVFAGVKSPHFV